MDVPAYAIGLPEEWVAEIKERAGVRYIAHSEVVPNSVAVDGYVLLGSQQTIGRWLRPNIVLWYGYFPASRFARTAIAISNTPSFPDIRKTLPWDDKTMAVIMAQDADEPVDRGLAQGPMQGPWSANTVLKWGDSHCGENKQLMPTGKEQLDERAGNSDILSEPFIEGESHRILIVGYHMSQLVYESNDWRKNVNSTITLLSTVDPDLVERTLTIVRRYGLTVAGLDFVLGEGRPTLLELNAYPSLDEDPVARETFIKMAVHEVQKAQNATKAR